MISRSRTIAAPVRNALMAHQLQLKFGSRKWQHRNGRADRDTDSDPILEIRHAVD